MSDNITNANSRILIAEDQTDLREMIATSLELSGHSVISTSDGQQAVEQAEQLRPDLIILDLNMPRLDGHQVCARLKAQDKFQRVPILIISAYGSPDLIEASIRLGALEFISKPFELDHLIRRVDALLTNA
ncbi:MAG: response regulator [Anaerolineales bacterium]